MSPASNGRDDDALRDLTADPSYAIEIASEPRPPLTDVDSWVAANVLSIEEEGAEAWLRRLLRVLQGDGAHTQH